MQGLWVQFLVRELRSSMSSGQKTKQKQYYNKFNKDFKNGPLKKKVLKIKILQSCCWFTSREAMSGRGKGGKGLGKATLSATARFWATTSRASLNLLSAAWLVVVVWSASLGSSTKRPAGSWKCFWRTWSGTRSPTPSMPSGRQSPLRTWSTLSSARAVLSTALAVKLSSLLSGAWFQPKALFRATQLLLKKAVTISREIARCYSWTLALNQKTLRGLAICIYIRNHLLSCTGQVAAKI